MAELFTDGWWAKIRQLKNSSLQHLCKNLGSYVLASKEPSTIRKYIASFERFKRWTSQFPDMKPLPADPIHVAAYFSHLANAGVYSAIETAYYGISWAHKTADLPDPTLHHMLAQCKEGMKRLLARPQSKRIPAPLKLIQDLAGWADNEGTLVALRISAICCLAYGGFLRYSDFSRLHLRDIAIHENHMVVSIRKSKTDVYCTGQSVTIARSGNPSCPVSRLEKYLDAARFSSEQDAKRFIFRAICGSGKKARISPKNSPLSYSRANEIFKSTAKKLGYDPQNLSLHSLRIGGATEAARNGINPGLLKKQGRWKSDSSKDLYVRFTEAELLKISLATGV